MLVCTSPHCRGPSTQPLQHEADGELVRCPRQACKSPEMNKVQSLPAGSGRDPRHEQGHEGASPEGQCQPRDQVPKSLNQTGQQVCEHACAHTHTCAHRQPHMYTHTQDINAHTQTHMHTHCQIHTDVRTGTYTGRHIRIHTRTYKQAYVYTETHIHIHTDTNMYTLTCAHRQTPLSCFSFLLCMCHHLTHCYFTYFLQTLVHSSRDHRLARALLL